MSVSPRFLFPSALVILLLPLTLFAQPGFDPDSLFLEGLRFQRAGDLRSAAQRYQHILAVFPVYHDVRIQLAAILAWEGSYQQSLAQYDSVLVVEPRHFEAWLGKSRTLELAGQYRQAADILEILLQEDPKSTRILFALGRIYSAGGAPRRALKYYERAYLRAPREADIMRALARTHRTLGNADLARYWYRKLLAALPGDAEARAELRRLEFRETHEINLTATYESFKDRTISNHSLLQAEYYSTLNQQWKPFLHVSRIDKFAQRDLRIGGGVYMSPAPSFGLFVQALLSPNAHFAPELDAVVEVSGPGPAGIEVSAGYRYMRFGSSNVHVGMPGTVLYFSDDAWLGVKGYFGFVPGLPVSSAVTGTLWLRADDFTMVRLGGFRGNEIIAATTLTEIATLRSSGGLLALRTRVSAHLALEGSYSYTSRSLLSDSHTLSVACIILF